MTLSPARPKGALDEQRAEGTRWTTPSTSWLDFEAGEQGLDTRVAESQPPRVS